MESNEKKEKVKYNILFVPDSTTADVKKISIKLEVLIAFFAAIAFLIIVAFVYCFILTGELEATIKTVDDLKSQISTLTEENSALAINNKELEDKVAILSDTVNDKVQKEEEIALAYLPTGFPLEGTAAYNEEETMLDGNAIAIFEAAVGTRVLATGSGTISSIAGNEQAGYIVMLDHENGYFSVYRNGSEPRVKEGDKVTNATEIFSIQEGKEKLGYQVIQNDVYIDPLEVMEIYG